MSVDTREYMKRWRKKNREHIREYKKTRYHDPSTGDREKQRASARRCYWRHREERQITSRKWNKVRLQKTRKYKEEVVKKMGGRCMDCGIEGPAIIYHFDHRDRSTKVANVSALIQSFGVGHRIIEDELAKCDLVCANCHAIRTWGNP